MTNVTQALSEFKIENRYLYVKDDQSGPDVSKQVLENIKSQLKEQHIEFNDVRFWGYQHDTTGSFMGCFEVC